MLRWMYNGIRALWRGIFGERNPPALPAPPPPEPELKPREPSPIDGIKGDISKLRESAASIRKDLDDLRNGGIVTKIKALARLKGEKDEALEAVGSLRQRVERLREPRDDGFPWWWGLLGIPAGLLKRRFA